MRLSRRGFLATAGSAALAGCGRLAGTDGRTDTTTTSGSTTDGRTGETTRRPTDDAGIDQSRFAPARTDGRLHLSRGGETFRKQTVASGAGKDGIPTIDQPHFVDPEEASELLDDGDVVFGLVYEGVARAYPQRILVYHEVCNDLVAGDAVSVTYCPLTGTAVGFDPGGTSFGVSGFLLNSNLVLYDRWTESWWPQILATAIPGRWNEDPPEGSLCEVRLVWTTWRRWRALYPDTGVLSRHTGYLRNYTRDLDPYGSYQPNRSGYYVSDGIAYPTFHRDDRYHAKRVVMGVRTAAGAAAFLKDALRERGTITGEVGSTPVVAVYDPRLDTAYVYRNPEGASVAVEGNRTTLDGTGYAPDALPLERVYAFDAMWFAWVGLYPETGVYE